MHGSARPMIFWLLSCAGAAIISGCDEAHLPTYFGDDENTAPAIAPAIAFDPTTTGSIAGQVTWTGKIPQVQPYLAPISPLSEAPVGPKVSWPNPHAPLINANNAGIAGAVVFLRGVEPERARPWDLPPVRVSVKNCQYHVLQGNTDSYTGFVRRGDAVTIVSEDDRFHSVQARGSAFFTLTLPDSHQPHARILSRTGIVELSSNAGQFWMHAHLFVADHPYLTHTDSEGRFVLEQVPPGCYELACWLPDWREMSHELDGETALVSRLTFRPAVVKLKDVIVERDVRRSAEFSFGMNDFGR